jgi:hypothetical protein
MRTLTTFNPGRRNALSGIAGTVASAAMLPSAMAFLQKTPHADEASLSREQVAALLKPLFSCEDPAIWQLLIDAYSTTGI